MLCLRRANEKPACTFLSGSSSTLLSDGACVEVDSDTEAVVHGGFKLGCISCKMRGEVEASATVDWWFMAKGEEDFTHIYSYADMVGTVTDERFVDRLDWNGSKKTVDLQDGSIYILNVTFNDTGTYRCYFDRMLNFEHYEYRTNTTKFITINVVAKEFQLWSSTFHTNTWWNKAYIYQEINSTLIKTAASSLSGEDP
uniref:Sodium channel regulatory subunit beta-3 n=1 Tax=Astyanax mexicanus TaxID=7994 RepID=A0A8B9H852_ASTMX